MRYYYRAHTTPEAVLDTARSYFTGHGLTGTVTGDDASFADARGTVTVHVEIEGGGHYTRVNVGTDNVGESEIDKVAKRFLTELHAAEDPKHVVRGAY